MKKLFALILAVMLLCGCKTLGTVFHAAILSSATAGARMNELSADAYRQHAADVRATVLAHHPATTEAGLAEYDEAIKPADAELDKRTKAIGALSAALYAAATLKQALDSGELTAAIVAQNARAILSAAGAAMDSLQEGLILPPVPIPAEVRSAVKALEALTSAFAAPSN